MEHQASGNPIKQQPDQQCAEIPFSNELQMGIRKDSNSDETYEARINNLESQVRSTDRLMAILTGIIAFITFGGVVVAFFQWNTVKNQFFQDQRPYVMVRAYIAQFAANQEVIVNLRIGNYGKSPAIKEGGMGAIFWGNDALERADQWFDKEAPKIFGQRNETIIPPGTPSSHEEAIISTLTAPPMSEKEFIANSMIDYSVVVVSRQAYLDGAGNQYWTDLCIAYLASKAIAYCSKHNEIH